MISPSKPQASSVPATPPRLDLLQATWEDRWMMLNAPGQATWLARADAQLQEAPLSATPALLRALRRLRDSTLA